MRTALSILTALMLLASNATAQQTHVSGRVSKRVSGMYEVYEPFLRVSQSVSAFGTNGFSFNGWPFSGQITGTEQNFSIFGGGVHATVSAWSGAYRVHATVNQPSGPTLRLFFTLRADGRWDDPKTPPSFSVWDDGVNLTLRPWADGREYDMSGWVDKTRFGANGTSLVGLVAAVALHRLETGRPKAGAGPAPVPAPLKLWQRPPAFR